MNIASYLQQPWGKLAFLDVLVIMIYMLVCLYLGFRKSDKIKDIKEFAIGDGTISTFVLVCTIYATHLGAGVTFGTLEKIRELGLLFAISLLAGPLGWLLKIWIFGKNIEQFNGCISLNDIMYKLYGPVARWVTSTVSIIIAIGTLAAQASASGYIMHYFLDIPINQGIFVSIGVLILYSAFGGVKAVALTDVVQFIVFYIIIPCICVVGLYQIKGISELQASIPQESMSFNLNLGTALLLLGFCIRSLTYGSSNEFIQRFLMSGNSKQLIHALKAVAALDFCMSMMLAFVSFILMALFPLSTSSKASFLQMAVETLPIGITGFFIIGLLAIIMSTADSNLNAAAIVCTHDIIRKLWKNMSTETELLLARCSTIVIGGLSIMIALSGKGILEIIWFIGNFYDPIILAPLVAGFLGMRTNSRSFVVAASMGTICMFTGAYLQGDFGVVSFTIGIIGNTIGLLLSHRLQIYMGWLELAANEETDVIAENHLSWSERIYKWYNTITKLRLKHIITYCNKAINHFPPNYYGFGIWAFAYCFYPFLFLTASGKIAHLEYHYMEIFLFVISVAGCSILLFKDTWPSWLRKKYLGMYWYLLLILIPLISVYELIMRYDNPVFLLHAAVGILMLVTFANNASLIPLLIVGTIVGSVLGYITRYFIYPIETSSVMTPVGNLISLIPYFIIICGISNELLHKAKSLLSLSVTDGLTKIHNRRYFDTNIDDIIENALNNNRALSIIMIDLDNFGTINKTYGHQAGDKVLQELAKRLKNNFRPNDLCARYGGEEFVVVMPNTDMHNSKKIAERLRDIIASHPFKINIKPHTLNITASIGVATLQSNEAAQSLISRADEALKYVKSNSKNAVMVAGYSDNTVSDSLITQ